MKKRCSLILVLLILTCQLIGCDAHDNTSPTTVPTTECSHNYSSVVTREATYDAAGILTYTCVKCQDSYTEEIPKLEKHVVPKSVLDNTVSNAKYKASAYSISVGRLVNSAMDGYTLKHYSGTEAISNGYLKRSQIDNSVDIDNLYCSIISGDTMVNPDIPYMTEYEQQAVKVWMIFDENDTLLNYGVELCDNLQTCAILIMTRGY